MQPTGCVDQDHIHAPRLGGGESVEDDRRRIGPLLVPNHLHADPASPQFQLLDRRRAERISGHQQRRQPVLLQPLRQLGDRGRLADAVDTDGKNHERF